MTQDQPELDREREAQREVTRVALDGVQGFALAGSGAIRKHGVIDRPTEDVDLFTNRQEVTEFSAAVDQVTEQLQRHGFVVEQTRRAPRYARLHVTTRDGSQLDVDLGVDWRRDDPVRLDVGPVLSLADAVGNKVSALCSRAEARDYLDVGAIRRSGLFSDDQLVAVASRPAEPTRRPGCGRLTPWTPRASAPTSPACCSHPRRCRRASRRWRPRSTGTTPTRTCCSSAS